MIELDWISTVSRRGVIKKEIVVNFSGNSDAGKIQKRKNLRFYTLAQTKRKWKTCKAEKKFSIMVVHFPCLVLIWP